MPPAFLAILIVCVTSLALCVALPLPSRATSDTTPPEILSFDIEPGIIWTGDADQYVTVTLHVTDDLSGFAHAGFSFGPMGSGRDFGVGVSSPDALVSGDALDGVYADANRLKRYSQTGWWQLTDMWLYDEVGNMARRTAPCQRDRAHGDVANGR